MKNIQVKTRIADSTIDLTFPILVSAVIRITSDTKNELNNACDVA